MAWTQADLEILNAAIATGARAVQYKDRQITYHSLEHMLRARRLIMDELNALAGTPTVRRSYAAFSKE